ncbi:MAG: VWA domain-containing protein [Polyangiaceae bacterium]|nr:VWA domain-containing protein [Polyangiaceae bacterium]
MTFLVTAALAIALLVVLPVAAHLLRRGRAREREFPPAALVSPAPPVARQRSRIEDRSLLAARCLVLLGLAVLGAMPLVRCSRLSLSREGGASVALAIVLDDSASMRVAMDGGISRWSRATAAARALLRSCREGDAVAIVLAGQPARLALAATTDLSAARAALETVPVTDRPTDLANAVRLARSALAELPHVDQRVLLLSDLAGEDLPAGSPPPWVPLPELARPAADCGVVRADRRGSRVTAEVACSSREAAKERQLEVVTASTPLTGAGAEPAPSGVPLRPRTGTILGAAAVAEQAGTQTVVVDLSSPLAHLDARLTGSDAESHDDEAPVTPERAATAIGVLTDPTSATAVTGGPPILEQALDALETRAIVKPLTLLPDEAATLAGLSALILDDPSGIGPEAREALGSWLDRGGVALALLGSSIGRAALGATLAPFVTESTTWTETTATGIDPTTATFLGPEAGGLAELAPKGRVALAGSVPNGARLLARWDDGAPFLYERDLGRGLVVTAALPASPAQSDFALRPGFLALLAYVMDEAVRRRGERVTVAGNPWTFYGEGAVRVTPPTGAPFDVLPERDRVGGSRAIHVPSERGRYVVARGSEVEARIVTVAAEEITRPPRDPARLSAGLRAGGVMERVDISREAALMVLFFFAAELMIRAATRWRERKRSAAL